ncbi:MAG TPA: FxLYD domain-containing protein [Acidimicrobiales bacterium]|nr:FxLYD domain-containing protein [Acidimicrobiales bacterium]
MRWALAVFVAVSTACGGGGGSGRGSREIPAEVRTDPPTIISSSKTECHFDGDRQVFASGVVKNGGDDEHNVNIAVRFLDADDVRIDLMSDSVSSLERGESAHWSVTLYPDRPDDVAKCEITTTAS